MTRRRALALPLGLALGLSSCGGTSADEGRTGTAAKPGVGYRTVGPATIASRVARGEVLLVDVRERGEWRAGHAPRAVHVPLAQVGARLTEIDRRRGSRAVAFICRSGRRSAEASRIAVKGGLPEVVNVAGGMGAWSTADLPLVPPGGRII